MANNSGEKKQAQKRFDWELYERMKKDAPHLLELGCDEFAEILVKD